LVCVNKLLKSQTRLAFCHSVGRVSFSIDPLDISNQASLVGLSKAHNINYESLFLYSSKAYKTVVKRLRVCNLNQRQVDLYDLVNQGLDRGADVEAVSHAIELRGSGCRMLSKELGGGSDRSEEAVRRRSCCRLKSDACKERECRAEKVEA
jgi:hypothetical protein